MARHPLTTACLSVEEGTPWPRRLPELVCTGGARDLRLRPVPAFDPSDDPADGVCVVRDVAKRIAAFRVPEMADAVGMLPQGSCGVRDGTLWMELGAEYRRQACVLVFEDDREQIVPITLVRRLERCPQRDVRTVP